MKTQHIMTSDLLATGQCSSAVASHITIYGEKQDDLMILKQYKLLHLAENCQFDRI